MACCASASRIHTATAKTLLTSSTLRQSGDHMTPQLVIALTVAGPLPKKAADQPVVLVAWCSS